MRRLTSRRVRSYDAPIVATTPARSPDAAEDTGAGGRLLTSGRLVALALGLVLLPVVVSAVALVVSVGTSYLAGSDIGLTELRTDDVGRHQVLLGPYSRDGWNHPGPALFYALALPYRLAGGNSIGLGLGALLINGVAIAGMAVVAYRRGGVAFTLITLAGCAVLMRALGPEFLRDPWNPYVTVLPFGFLVFLTWAMTCGEAWALPVAVAVASFCVQTHVGYAPIAFPLLAWGGTWLAVLALRQRDHQEHKQRSRDLVRAAIAAVTVLVVMWLPVVVQQLTGSSANLTEILRHFSQGEGQRHSLAEGYRVMSGQFGLTAQWLTGHLAVVPFSGEPVLLSSTPLPVLLIPFGLAGFAFWRWRCSEAVRLVATLILTLALGVFSVTRIIGPAYEYRLRWTWFLGMLASVVVIWAAWTVISRRAHAARVLPLLLAVPISALVALGGVNAVSAARAGTPKEDISSAVRTVGSAVEAALPKERGDVLLRSTSFESDGYLPTLMLYLERHGVAARLDRWREDAYGAHRVHRRGAPIRAVLTLAADKNFDDMVTRPDFNLVAYWGERTREERLDVLARRAELEESYEAGEMSLESLARRLSSIPLGSAVGVFTQSPTQ
jgi:hypothetical protein